MEKMELKKGMIQKLNADEKSVNVCSNKHKMLMRQIF